MTDRIAAAIRDIADFPKPGIGFKDITPLLRDHELFAEAIRRMADPWRDQDITAIVAVDARGFIFGTAIACELKLGLIPVRKKGKLPAETIEVEYALEYGTNTLQMHRDALGPADRVLIADDVLATGGTALAAAKLIENLGATVAGFSFLMELDFLHGRDLLENYQTTTVVNF